MRSLKGLPVRPIRRSQASRLLTAFAIAGLVAACGESTPPTPPASVAVDNTTIADGTAGLVLAPSPSFLVKDADGNVLADVSISVAVTAGGGTLTDAPTRTRGGGATSVGTWKLGNVAGANTITVTVGGLPPLVITVNGRAGPPASIAFISGANQSALAGAAVANAPVAQVRDQFSNGVPGIAVTFTISDGAGSVSSTPVTTNAAGNATSPEWRLGKSAVTQMLAASIAGFSASVPATVSTSYAVDVRFFGPTMIPQAAEAFVAAAARIRGSVIGDVTDIQTPPAGIDMAQCGVPGVILNELVDDVIIYATATPIDGAGKVLGSAGPCFVRSSGRQTIVGIMRFDSDDIQGMIDRGNLREVIQHEMLHVVGIGTLWSDYGVIVGAGTPETRFTGSNGVAACIGMGGGVTCPGSVPVENEGGPGSADGHWRETVFGTELMTSRIGTTGNALSLMSIQSLSDVGYVVNANAADPFVIPGTGAVRMNAVSGPASTWEILLTPKFEMTRTGRITPVEKR